MFAPSNILKDLNRLESEYSCISKNIILLEGSLSDYKKELTQLQAKHNVLATEFKIKQQNMSLKRTYRNILKLKCKYLSELIIGVINHKEVSLNNTEKNYIIKDLFGWLEDNYSIKFRRQEDYITFEKFYKDHINIGYKDIDMRIHDDYVLIHADYYFRGEHDDTIDFIIPLKVLNKVETLEKDFAEFLNNLIQKKEELKKEQRKKAEQREYAQFLRLKEKFENK